MHFNVCTLAFYLTVSILGSVLIGAAVLVPHSQGRQEDAEEYLGFTLNGLHEEMLALKKLISPQEESKHLFTTSISKQCHKADKVITARV